MKDDEGWDRPPRCIDPLDYRSPLAIALLNALWLSSTLRACNDCSSRYHAYHEARLVKVEGVLVKDTVLSLCVLYKLKPALYNLRILAESSLVVVLTIKLDFKLRATFNEGCSLVLANRVLVPFSKQ